MDIREEIPIKSFSIAAYMCQIVSGRGRYLILKRSSAYLHDSWQMVSGRIELGERGWEAALREMKEETGLVPDRFYSADAVEQFYEVSQNCINLVPVFVGFIDTEQPVILSGEHGEYKWIFPEEAEHYLVFQHQRAMLEHIERQFVQKTPHEFLRIDVLGII
jgi:dATP pyrophosphohydrolase